jgi:hypothetical protein
MILSDAGAAAMTVIIAVLLYFNSLEIWHIYITVAVSRLFGSFQFPAYSDATTLLVPKDHLSRAAGMVQTSHAVSQILSPAIAGALIVTIHLWGIIIIDFATFLFALATLLFVSIPRPEISTAGEEGRGSLWQEATFGWKYIKVRHGLLALLIFFACINFSFALFVASFTPMVLSFASPPVLGTVQSVGGIGMLFGGLVLSAWGGPKRRVYGVLGFGLLSGTGLLLSGIRPSVPLIAGAIFLIFFAIPLINGCSQAIWQIKTPPDIQGRVFSVRAMIAWSTTSLSYILAGPLADKIFNPLLTADGSLAGSVGKVIGVGPGRGIGLMLIIMGALVVLTAAVSFLYPQLRYLEDEVPDAVET